jgi:hypothetical protein
MITQLLRGDRSTYLRADVTGLIGVEAGCIAC